MGMRCELIRSLTAPCLPCKASPNESQGPYLTEATYPVLRENSLLFYVYGRITLHISNPNCKPFFPSFEHMSSHMIEKNIEGSTCTEQMAPLHTVKHSR